MADVVATRREDLDCAIRVRSELVSLGGGVLLALCLVMTALFIMIAATPAATTAQKVISAFLFVGAWAYFANSITEKLYLTDNTLVFSSALMQRRIPLKELQAMVLIHEGLNLEHGIETLELHRLGKRVDRIALGPCWQRNKLESFLHSIEEKLRSTSLLEEVR